MAPQIGSAPRGTVRRVALAATLALPLSGCCPFIPGLCPPPGVASLPPDGGASQADAEAAVVRGLAVDLLLVVQSDPELAARAAAVASEWAPIAEELRSGTGREAVVTPEMVGAVEELLPDLLAAADDGTRAHLRDLLGRIDLRSLVGAGADDVLSVVVTATKGGAGDPPAILTLGARERGLARAGETVLIPAAAHVGGAQDTRWRTDLMVVNPAEIPAAATVAMLRRDTDNSAPQTVALELAPGEAVFAGDALDSLFSFSGAASLRLTAVTGAVTVTSRTYNLLGAGNPLGLPPGSTFGQFVPALSDDDAIPYGDEGHLIQLSHDPALAANGRTNLILVNGGAAPITAETDLYQGTGAMIGRVTRQLRAWEYIQLDRVFEEVTTQPVANGYAVVRTTTPGGRLFALASVVDNLTGDPIAIPSTLASYQTEVTSADTQTIPAAAHVQGAAGTNWRTDLVLHHLSGQNTLAVVELLRRGQGNPQPEQRQVAVLQGQALRFDDVLVSLFATEGAGAVRITSYGGPLAVSSRTYNLIEAGNPQGLPEGSTFGQYLAPVGWLKAIRYGERALLGHLSHDPSLTDGSRTNLLIVNNAYRDAEYEVELFRAEGSSLGSFTTTLGTWEFSQIDRVFERVTSERVDSGYAVVQAISPWGVFHAQASVVDNRTGDPITVDGIALRAPRRGGLVESGNMLFDALGDGSLLAREALLLLTEEDAEALLDALAAAAPHHVTRTPDGVVIDAGLGELTPGGYIVGGRIELALADGFASGGGQINGGFTLTGDGFHVDGVTPAVDTIQGSVDLEQVAGDHVVGTITLTPQSAAPTALTGTVQIDTRICALYPIGGSISVDIGGETRTISFSPTCSGSYGVQFPSAARYSYEMLVRNCDGSWQGSWDTMFLISEDGLLVADPTVSPPYGRATWTAAGALGFGDVQLRYARPAGRSPDGVERVGWYRGLRNEPYPGTIYYTGVYGYRVREGACTAYYNHSRRDPEFSVGILQPCDGPCTPAP